MASRSSLSRQQGSLASPQQEEERSPVGRKGWGHPAGTSSRQDSEWGTQDLGREGDPAQQEDYKYVSFILQTSHNL